MRVIVLNWLDRENPRAGGAEVHLHETFGRLAHRGHEVVLASSGWTGAEPRVELDGIEVHRVGGRLTYCLEAPRLVRPWLADGAFDLVVEDLNKAPLFAPLWSGVPALLLVHHLFGATAFGNAAFPVAAATWALERAIPRAYRNTPTVAVSESTRSDLVARGLAGEGIRVVRNGVDTDAFKPSEERFPEPTILYLGRLARYKRVDLVLSATAAIRATGHSARLIVAGAGEDEKRLRGVAESLGLDEAAVSFVGHVPEDEKRDLYRKTWLHVLTSEKEGWGITNLEAGACGTPSVASDSPGLRESVVDGESGFLVPHGDIPALTDRILRLLDDPLLRAEMGRAARRYAEAHSWDKTADGIADAMQWAVDSLRAPR